MNNKSECDYVIIYNKLIYKFINLFFLKLFINRFYNS